MQVSIQSKPSTVHGVYNQREVYGGKETDPMVQQARPGGVWLPGCKVHVLSTRSSKPLAACYQLSCRPHDIAPGLPPVPLVRGSSGSQLTMAARLAGKADLTLHQAGPQTHCLEIRVMMDA